MLTERLAEQCEAARKAALMTITIRRVSGSRAAPYHYADPAADPNANTGATQA